MRKGRAAPDQPIENKARRPGQPHRLRRDEKRRYTRPILLSAAALLAIAAVIFFVQPQGRSEPSAPPAQQAASHYQYRIVNVFPHDPDAFVQGLIFRDGYLYESTGLNGRSSLRKVRLETGEVLQKRTIESKYFAEGLTDLGSKLFQLTWQSNVGFVYRIDTLDLERSFSYTGEGWGLTHDANRLIMSDGTSTLGFLDPSTLRVTTRLPVTDGGQPVGRLNELEMVKGEVFANVWPTDRIAVIQPQTGRVTGWLDLTGLLPPSDRARDVDVLNGIAYDAKADKLFVTGKLWPKLFEIRLEPRQ